MKFIINTTNTMIKTLVFLYICKHKTQKRRVKTPTGKKIDAFETRGGIKWTDRGGELNKIWCKNKHPYKLTPPLEAGLSGFGFLRPS